MKNFSIFEGFDTIISEVALALIPLILVFVFFQALSLKLSPKKLRRILIGFGLTFVGLSIFLQGVQIGFLPAGRQMGIKLGDLHYNWVLVPVGFLLGFVATLAEPGVRILNYEVEKASGGYIPQKAMLFTLSFGVATAIALSMAKIIFGLSLWHFIIPGYLAAFILMRYTKRTFVSIAFDSGGVATGPMTVTFIMAIAIGVASSVEGRIPLMDGFGMVAMVYLFSILSVLILGLLYSIKERDYERKQQQ
ncbi:MAG: DUF1538 domain-containing protein [Dethiobacteria bacterium]